MLYLTFISFGYPDPSFRCIKVLLYHAYINDYHGHRRLKKTKIYEHMSKKKSVAASVIDSEVIA